MCPLLQAALQPHPAIVLADLRALQDRLHRALVVGQLETRAAHPARRGDVPLGLHTQRAQTAVEALARPVTPPDGLVDAGSKQQLGRDLARALGRPDLVPAHPRPPTALAPAVVAIAAIAAHPLRVDGVR